MREASSELKEHPEDGCYINGLFAEGCRWDPARHQLTESCPKELYTDMPCLWLMPTPDRKPPESGVYDCPVYKTLTRAGKKWDIIIFGPLLESSLLPAIKAGLLFVSSGLHI